MGSMVAKPPSYQPLYKYEYKVSLQVKLRYQVKRDISRALIRLYCKENIILVYLDTVLHCT